MRVSIISIFLKQIWACACAGTERTTDGGTVCAVPARDQRPEHPCALRCRILTGRMRKAQAIMYLWSLILYRYSYLLANCVFFLVKLKQQSPWQAPHNVCLTVIASKLGSIAMDYELWFTHNGTCVSSMRDSEKTQTCSANLEVCLSLPLSCLSMSYELRTTRCISMRSKENVLRHGATKTPRLK